MVPLLTWKRRKLQVFCLQLFMGSARSEYPLRGKTIFGQVTISVKRGSQFLSSHFRYCSDEFRRALDGF